MPSPSRPALALALVSLAPWSLAEPRRPAGSPPPPPPPSDFAPPPPVVAPGPAPASMCNALLIVQRAQTRSGCQIDERVTRAPGVLEFPCAGGPATARFGDSHFTGVVDGGAVNVALRTRFHFSDGCDWESVQSVSGDLASGRLTFTYAEAPLPGQARCANACQAVGAVQVQR